MRAVEKGIEIKQVLCLMSLFVLFFSSIGHARHTRDEHNCDFAAVITRAKAGRNCLIAQMPPGPGGITDPDDPEDLFYDFLIARSSLTTNDDGYRLVYYRDGEKKLSEYQTAKGDYPYRYPYWSPDYYNYNNNTQPMENAHADIMDEANQAVIVMGHDRNGTSGWEGGNHPFTFEWEGRTWSFMHNGSIPHEDPNYLENIRYALWYDLYYNTGNGDGEWFGEHPSNWVRPENVVYWDAFIDSELLFHWIMKNILEKEGDVLAGLYQALTAEIYNPNTQGTINLYSKFEFGYSTSKINFVLCDGESLYVFRNTPWDWSQPPGDWDHEVSYEVFDVEGGFVGVKTQDPLQNRLPQFTLAYIPRLGEPVEFPQFLDGYSNTWIVPGDFATIQAAIDASTDGDRILVRPGPPYVENIDFLGKAVTLRSDQDGDPGTKDLSPETTIIDGNQANSVVVFQNQETPLSRLEGFTITNGDPGGLKYGGGVLCKDFSCPTLIHNIIADNRAKYGGGISCLNYASPLIRENYIESNDAKSSAAGLHLNLSVSLVTHNFIRWNVGGINYANAQGGGLGIHLCELKLVNNRIIGNLTYGSGGAISANESDLILTNNTVWGNQDQLTCDGIYLYNGSDLRVANTILWENSFNHPYEIVLGGWGDHLAIDHSDLQGGRDAVDEGLGGVVDWDTGSMIDLDPLFQGILDFHLSALSPCIDAGTNQAPFIPLVDMDGEPRICFGPEPGQPGPIIRLWPVVDMGADEYPGADPSRHSCLK